MSIVMIGRVISGAGGAGMSSVVSFIIADLVPPREVATHRSYVNIVQTVGRSCGGPVGGWLAQTMGWRWYGLPKLQFRNDSKRMQVLLDAMSVDDPRNAACVASIEYCSAHVFR